MMQATEPFFKLTELQWVAVAFIVLFIAGFIDIQYRSEKDRMFRRRMKMGDSCNVRVSVFSDDTRRYKGKITFIDHENHRVTVKLDNRDVKKERVVTVGFEDIFAG
jgi:hypothetical protein